MSIILQSAKNGNDDWTSSWWNPSTYPVDFTFKNTGDTVEMFSGIRWAIVAGNSGGYTIDPYGTFNGTGCTVALYQDDVKVSTDVVIPDAVNHNLANKNGLLYSNTINTASFFVPRQTADGTKYEHAGHPSENQDTISKITRDIKLINPIKMQPNDTITLTLKSVGVGNVVSVSAIEQISLIPTYKVTWQPNGGNWDGNTANIIENIIEGNDAAVPENPTRTNYEFLGWSPNSGWTNITEDKVFTATWKLKGIIWVRENGEWVKKLYPHKYNATTKEWSDLSVHKKNSSGWSDV